MSQQIQSIDKQEGKFIYYDGMYWLVHHFDKDLYGGGWFASPLFSPKPDEIEVSVGAGNWCYASNGAYLKDPDTEMMKRAYQNYLEHLKWCRETQIKQNCDLTTINGFIKYYGDLL